MILTDVELHKSCATFARDLLSCVQIFTDYLFTVFSCYFAEMAWMRLSNGQSTALKTDETIIPNGKVNHHEKVSLNAKLSLINVIA